jgi:hypothetical protein
LRPVFFVRWKAATMQDIPTIDRELDAAYKANGGPIIYVAILPEDATPPDDKTRAEFIKTMQDVLTRCETMHFVMEGQGFKHAVLRTSVATILLVRGQRTKVFVHTNLEEALAKAADKASAKLKFSPAVIMRQAKEAELVTVARAASAGVG